MKKLTQIQINKRMQEWRNIKVLHKKAIEENKKLKKRIKELETENRNLILILEQQNEIMATLQLRIEELEQMVFGRKKKKKDDDEDDDFTPKREKKKPKKKR